MDSMFFGTQNRSIILYLLLYGNIKMSLGLMADSFNWMRGVLGETNTSSASRQTIIYTAEEVAGIPALSVVRECFKQQRKLLRRQLSSSSIIS